MKTGARLTLLAASVAFAAVGARSSESPSGAVRRPLSQSPVPRVVRVKIDGELDVGTIGLVQRGLRATENGGDRLVLEIDTPGGSVEHMWKLARKLDEASRQGLLTVAWVHGHAMSAGALVALTCERIYMRSSASIGSALPVTVGPEGLEQPSDPAVREKLQSALRADFRAWAERRGRPPLLAEAMVDPEVEVRQVRSGGETVLVSGKEWDDALERGEALELVRTVVPKGHLLALTAAEAVELGMADGLAEDFDALLEKIGASGAEVVQVERSRSEDLAALLDRVRLMLLVVALVAAYIEFKAPGFSVAGIVSVASFAVLLFGQYLAGLADIPHIVAVALGLVLVAAELFAFPGTVWPSLVGALLVLGGLTAAALGPGWDMEFPLDRKIAIDSAFRSALAVSGALLLAALVSRWLPRAPILRGLVLSPKAADVHEGHAQAAAALAAGARGRALSALRPVGKVALDAEPGQEFEAQASGPAIERGASILVVEIRAGRLVVEQEELGSEDKQ